MANMLKSKKYTIMKELEKLVTEGTILGVTNEQLAVKFQTRANTIGDYLKQIYLKIPPEDIKETEVKLKAMFDKIFRFSQQILSGAETLYEKERAIRLIMQAMKEYMDFLERFGVKPKVADNLNINANITNKQLIINYNMPDNKIENE